MFSITQKMKKLYYVICSKHRKFEKPKISQLLHCNKCKNENERIFKDEESIEMLKIISLIENI